MIDIDDIEICNLTYYPFDDLTSITNDFKKKKYIAIVEIETISVGLVCWEV